jgi:signal transduction histidine kinase
MDQLTTDLLNYSRVARAEVKLERIEPEPLVRAVIEHYTALQDADIRIVSPLPAVLGHDTSLTQVVSNLLTNAAKFVKPGERARITVRGEHRNGRIRLSVEDAGIGVPPQYQGALFRIFERVPTEGSYEGTGVGLAIVRKAVEKMGGACGMQSDGRTGSVFWIELAAA